MKKETKSVINLKVDTISVLEKAKGKEAILGDWVNAGKRYFRGTRRGVGEKSGIRKG